MNEATLFQIYLLHRYVIVTPLPTKALTSVDAWTQTATLTLVRDLLIKYPQYSEMLGIPFAPGDVTIDLSNEFCMVDMKGS